MFLILKQAYHLWKQLAVLLSEVEASNDNSGRYSIFNTLNGMIYFTFRQ